MATLLTSEAKDYFLFSEENISTTLQMLKLNDMSAETHGSGKPTKDEKDGYGAEQMTS